MVRWNGTTIIFRAPVAGIIIPGISAKAPFAGLVELVISGWSQIKARVGKQVNNSLLQSCCGCLLYGDAGSVIHHENMPV